MPKKIKKIISIIGVGGGQPDDGKFHHVFTFFFLNPSLSEAVDGFSVHESQFHAPRKVRLRTGWRGNICEDDQFFRNTGRRKLWAISTTTRSGRCRIVTQLSLISQFFINIPTHLPSRPLLNKSRVTVT